MKAVPPPDAIIHSADPTHPVLQAASRVLLAILAWFASVQAVDLQVWVAIVGGLGVAIYTWLNAYVLWRDKVRKPANHDGL